MNTYGLYDEFNDCFIGEERYFHTDAEAVETYENALRDRYSGRTDLNAVLRRANQLKVVHTDHDGTKRIVCAFGYRDGGATITANINKHTPTSRRN